MSDEKKKRQRPSGKWMLSMGAVAVLGVLGAGLTWYGVRDRAQPAEASVRVLDASRIETPVGGEGTPQYNRQIDEANAQGAQQAIQNGQAFVPTPTGISSKPKQYLPPQPPKTEVQEPAPPPRVATARSRQAEALPVDARLQGFLGGVMSRWSASSAQATLVYAPPEPAKDEADAAAGAEAQAQASGSQSPAKPELKADIGDILYAVNLLKINSDAQTPVLAEVVSGPLRGARVIGGFALQEDRLVIRYTSLSLNGTTWAIEGYAIDPEQASPTLAGEVDYHYLSRWGGLMAASFLQGLGGALLNSGTTSTSVAGSGGVTTVTNNPTYSTSEQFRIAMGKVGEKAGEKLESGFDRPNTVTVDDRMPLGILLLNVEGRQ